MFISRRRGQPSPHLEWRIRIFGVGAILAIAGMIADLSWMIWMALAVLLVGFLLRFLPQRGSAEAGVEEDDSESDQP
jgi:hypothetical protein